MSALLNLKNCLIQDQIEICSSFNEHFVAAGHMFEDEDCGSRPYW